MIHIVVKYVIFLWLVLTHAIALCQIKWEKFYYDYNATFGDLYNTDSDIKYDSSNNEYIFFGLGYGKPSVYAISDSGNFLSRNYFSGIGGATPFSKLIKNNEILISSTDPYSTYVVTTLFKADSSYNILWKYQYDVPLSLSSGFFETTDNKLILTSTAHFTSYVRPFYVKTDSVGVILNGKYYTDLFAVVHLSIQTLDNNYLFAANTYLGEGFVLFKTDTSGHAIWSKSYLRPQGVVVDLLEKQNGNLILAGNTDVTFQTPYPKLFLMELDTVGNVLWTKTYGDSDYRLVYFNGNYYNYNPIKMKRTFDGGFVLVTTLNYQGTGEDLVVLKTDSTGNFEWEQRHGNGSDLEIGMNLIQAPDSGYFVMGAFYRNNLQTGYYLLKTDSLGSKGCSEISDLIPVNSLLPTDSSIVVTDSSIVINQYTALVTNTTDVPPNYMPGCIIDGIPANNLSGYELSVYPNPSTGVVHVAINTAEKKNIYIYDITGREIDRKENTSEPTLDIDLSVNAKGIYLLKVTTAAWNAAVKVALF